MALKPPSQAAVLRMNTDSAPRQVKHNSLKVTVPIGLLQFHVEDLPQ